MKNSKSKISCKRGFTLIELLVVVLIIGILAAVAVPQYKKAVMKSRYAKLKPLVQALADAEEVYYLAHGEYTAEISELDIDFPQTPTTQTTTLVGKEYTFDWGLISLVPVAIEPRVLATDVLASVMYGRYLIHSENDYAGMQRCSPIVTEDNSNEIGHQICQAESGLSEPSRGNNYYW